jgi:prepilin-type N-terminal cleavage/methylation domain-containing protein
MRLRRGFTVIELLVVITIIGVMIGLLLPAVQRVREAGNRMICANNLHQIGIALHSYYDQNKKFPPGYVDTAQWPQPDAGPGWGWAALILPFMEQTTLQNQINFTLNAEDSSPNIVNARVQFLSFFSCPSDKPVLTFTISDDTNTNTYEIAHGSYVACNGNDGVDDLTTPPHTGAFVRGTPFRIEDIQDGLSNTLFVGERCTTMSLSSWVGALTNMQVPSVRAPGNFSGASCLVLGHCGPHLPNDSIVTDADAFSSAHPLGVQFLFGDGAVRLIGNNIQQSVYDALATRNGGEPPNFDGVH